MSRALITFAVGEHEQLLELALPRFEAYADRHGYELETRPPAMLLRPPSWHKVPLLLEALERHDEALWIDADVVIVDQELDVADEPPATAWQALVRHHTPDGEVPNGGVWLVRQGMQPVLEAIWRRSRHRNHPWWEQAALMDLLGYRHAPAELVEPTELYRRTHWLGLEWNSHEQNDRHPSPRFAHATHGPVEWRASVMRAYLARAEHPVLTKGA